MIKFVSFLAIIAFALSASPVEAAQKKTPVATASAPAKNSPPKRELTSGHLHTLPAKCRTVASQLNAALKRECFA
jgi:hypothetical protein